MLKLPNLKNFSLQGKRAKFAFFHDIVMAGLSFLVALYLRVGLDFNHFPLFFVIQATSIYVIIATTVYWTMRLYAGVWRYTSIEDLLTIIRAVTIITLVFLAAMFLFSRLEFVPRSTLPINWLVLVAFLCGPRVVHRLTKDRRAKQSIDPKGLQRIPVLLVGASDPAELFIRTINRTRDSLWQVVGIIDEKNHRVGQNIHGVTVLGSIDKIPSIIEDISKRNPRPQRLIITSPRIDGDDIQKLLNLSKRMGVGLSKMPQLDDLRDNLETAPEIRPIRIEDLLGRPQATLDRESMAEMIGGRRILVTGAGGTIGAELCRQITTFKPALISLIDHSEYQLYTIDLELGEQAAKIPRHTILADVRDPERISQIFSKEKPEIVFHAAALKHVPMVELHPDEGALTNVMGTRIVADACLENNVLAMVLISTDKAVNPSSVMGATKRIAEQYCQALDLSGRTEDNQYTRFVTVRFGNVLGSTGSVVPLFQRQLASGGPLTVTHRDITRYFMTVREAVELVLQASVQGVLNKGDIGKIYVLDMGEPIKIIDLARQIIMLAGLRPDEDVKIEITGLRPGEKLSEELLHESEKLITTGHPAILLAAPRGSDTEVLKNEIDNLTNSAHEATHKEVRAIISRLVPEFQSTEINNGY